MPKIQVLDCTLRDGGYINQWKFGREIIAKTIDSLIKTQIDIIEIGFLTDLTQSSENVTLFDSIVDAINLIPSGNSSSQYVLMINHGEYDRGNVPQSKMLLGLWYAFRNHELQGGREHGT